MPAAVRAFGDFVGEHVRAFHALGGEPIDHFAVTCEQRRPA